jgi:hypothetical protein
VLVVLVLGPLMAKKSRRTTRTSEEKTRRFLIVVAVVVVLDPSIRFFTNSRWKKSVHAESKSCRPLSECYVLALAAISTARWASFWIMPPKIMLWIGYRAYQ